MFTTSYEIEPEAISAEYAEFAWAMRTNSESMFDMTSAEAEAFDSTPFPEVSPKDMDEMARYFDGLPFVPEPSPEEEADEDWAKYFAKCGGY